MNHSYRFNRGNMEGKIKKAEPEDNPGELMIISMPMAVNVNMSDRGCHETHCPLCNRKCWVSPHIADAAKMYEGRVIAACTECALQANINKGEIPKQLHEKGLHPNDLLQPILNLFK